MTKKLGVITLHQTAVFTSGRQSGKTATMNEFLEKVLGDDYPLTKTLKGTITGILEECLHQGSQRFFMGVDLAWGQDKSGVAVVTGGGKVTRIVK